MKEWMDGWMERQFCGWLDGQTVLWMDGWMDGWMDEWMDGWMNERLNVSSMSLQIGAQVMLLRNLELTSNDRMLVNGSRGVITKFVPKSVSSEFVPKDEL